MKIKSWLKKIKRHSESGREIKYFNSLYLRAYSHKRYTLDYLNKQFPDKEKNYVWCELDTQIRDVFSVISSPHKFFLKKSQALFFLKECCEEFRRFIREIDNVKENIEIKFPEEREKYRHTSFTVCKFVEITDAFDNKYVAYILNHIAPCYYIGISMDEEDGTISNFNIDNEQYLITPLFNERESYRLINQYGKHLMDSKNTFEEVVSINNIMVRDLENQMTYYALKNTNK